MKILYKIITFTMYAIGAGLLLIFAIMIALLDEIVGKYNGN